MLWLCFDPIFDQYNCLKTHLYGQMLLKQPNSP